MRFNLLDADIRVDDKKLYYGGDHVVIDRKELIYLCKFDDSAPRSRGELVEYIQKGDVRDEVVDFIAFC